MGKQGPCRHCGVISTPLWRNGPPDKPVLCNACGSRWRTKGSLVNYTPMHARETLESEEALDFIPNSNSNSSKFKSMPAVHLKNKKKAAAGGRSFGKIPETERETFSGQNFRKIQEMETFSSNRSSSGSAISYSESCGAHYSATDASDLTGSAQSDVWDPQVPSKKRMGVPRPKKPSRVEKLTRDLYSILQECPSSYLSGTSDEDLLYCTNENQQQMDCSIEIGSGSVLIRNAESESQSKSKMKTKSAEEESEASSFPNSNNKACVHNSVCASLSHENHTKRDSSHNEKLHLLRATDSPLISLDLKDIVNFESFVKYLTNEEQQRLLKLLSFPDTTKPPESLRSMFSSLQFAESLDNFQKLLGEGTFNLTIPGANLEECKNLKKLVLTSSAKSKWVEYYKQLKEKESQSETNGGKDKTEIGTNFLKRPYNAKNQNHSGQNSTMRSPKKMQKSTAGTDFKANFVAPLQYMDENENSNEDLLLDIPSNSSFMEAELLSYPSKLKIVKHGETTGQPIRGFSNSISNHNR